MSLASDEMKKAIRALLPDGPIWNQKPDGDFEKLLDGIGENWQLIYEFLITLADLRNPIATTLLSDLEKEFGVLTNTNLTEAERREQLEGVKYAIPKGGSASDLQDYLQAAGFNLIVTPNDPPVDPQDILEQTFLMVANGDNAYAGYYTNPTPPPVIEAIAGFQGGELIVNGPVVWKQTPAYYMQANGVYAYAGNARAVAGYHLGLTTDFYEYEIPTSSLRWPFVFFVGGPADLTVPTVEPSSVPLIRREELRRLIMKHKPTRSWCVLIVEYT